MLKKIYYFFYKCLSFLDKILYFLTKKKFLLRLSDFIQKDSYKSISILEKKKLISSPLIILQLGG